MTATTKLLIVEWGFWLFLAILLLVMALSSGCTSVARIIWPIQPSELEPAAQKIIAAKDTAHATQIKTLNDTIAKLKAKPPPTSFAKFYWVAAAAIVAGPVAWGIFKVLGLLGISGGGFFLLVCLQFAETYPWALWIPFGIMVVALVYALWKLTQTIGEHKKNETATQEAVKELNAGKTSTPITDKLGDLIEKKGGNKARIGL